MTAIRLGMTFTQTILLARLKMSEIVLIPHSPTYKNASKWAATWQNQQSDCAPSEDSDQPGHPPNLIRVFACAQWVAKDASFLHAHSEDWSDWVDAQADLSLRWAHSHLIGCVILRLKWLYWPVWDIRWVLREFSPRQTFYPDTGVRSTPSPSNVGNGAVCDRSYILLPAWTGENGKMDKA